MSFPYQHLRRSIPKAPSHTRQLLIRLEVFRDPEIGDYEG